MKRGFIFALVLLSAVGLIVHCGGGSGGNGAPDLSGTWQGTGWVDTAALGIGPLAAELSADPEIIVLCPSVDELVTVSLVLDSNGDPTDLLICAESIESILETDVTAVVDQADFGENVLWFLFSTTATGTDLYGGSLVLDDSADYATLYLWDAKTDLDLFLGVVQRTTGFQVFSEAAMVGPWSGFAVDFEEIGDTIFYEKLSPLDVTLSAAASLALTGTDPDGLSLSGILTMEDTNYGAVLGTITATIDLVDVDFILEGFVSYDGEYFGGAAVMDKGPPNEWSIINLRKQ